MRQQLTWTICSCTLIIWVGTQSWAYQDSEAKPVGLSGILAADPPAGLGEEDFEELSEAIDATWKTWVTETGELVQALYSEEPQTADEQRSTIEKLKARIRTLERALGDARYASIHELIGGLYQRLAPEVDLVDAMLTSLTIGEEAALEARISPAREQLNTAVNKLTADMRKLSGGSQWLNWAMTSQLTNFNPANESAVEAAKTVKAKLEKRESYSEDIRTFTSRESFLALEDALSAVLTAIAEPVEFDDAQLRKELAALSAAIESYREDSSAANEAALRTSFAAAMQASPDAGAALKQVQDAHYQNFNLRVSVSEGMLNRIIGDVRRDSSRINDAAMGARIVGTQSSEMRVRVDIQPSENTARFNLVLNGVISTNSLAYASEATIRTVGRHTVSAVKPVIYDGNEFRTEAARISVQANNQPVGVSTRYSGGLFGGYADRVAMREANARRGQANAYTQRSIQNEVSSSLNKEVDSRFQSASLDIQNRINSPLREYGLYPDELALSSTSSEIRYQSRLSAETELAGGVPVPGQVAPANGLLVQIHESLLTNGSNRLDLGTEGKTRMSEGELRSLLEERLSKILDREVKLSDSETEMDGNMFVFDEPGPIRFSIRDNSVIITVRAGLERDGGDNIPPQIITVPLTPSLQGDKLVLNRGNVGVRPVERPSSVAEQVARANVMRQKIQSALPEREFDAAWELDYEKRKISVTLTGISANNGWLTLLFQ